MSVVGHINTLVVLPSALLWRPVWHLFARALAEVIYHSLNEDTETDSMRKYSAQPDATQKYSLESNDSRKSRRRLPFHAVDRSKTFGANSIHPVAIYLHDGGIGADGAVQVKANKCAMVMRFTQCFLRDFYFQNNACVVDAHFAFSTTSFLYKSLVKGLLEEAKTLQDSSSDPT